MTYKDRENLPKENPLHLSASWRAKGYQKREKRAYIIKKAKENNETRQAIADALAAAGLGSDF